MLATLMVKGGIPLSAIFIAGHVRWYRPPEYYATSKWRCSWALDGGGALMNQAIHTVDVLADAAVRQGIKNMSRAFR